MIIILSPAKRMKADTDSLPVRDTPKFPEKTGRLKDYLMGLELPELRTLLRCNEKIALESYRRLRAMEGPRTPAIFAYQGIAFQYMAPTAFTDGEFDYVQRHLRILSGFYGMVRPFDGVYPYRLEMQARPDFCRDLYSFWGEDLGRALSRENDLIVDLASEEYSRAARRGIAPSVRWLTLRFGEVAGGKFREKGTACKMARGSMVRYMAERNITDPEALRDFNLLGYRFCPERSGPNEFVFCKE